MRNITLFILLFTVLSAFASKKMTVHNTSSNESFETSIPENLKIYEYNSNWLDSVPYLISRARYGEPWAYEALGECYCYGKGGVEQSIWKAFVYYELSGTNVEEMAMKTVMENPIDPLSLVYKMIDKTEAGDKDGILCILDTLNQEKYYEADILRSFIIDSDTVSLSAVIERDMISTEVSTDRMIFTLVGCMFCNWIPKSLQNNEDILSAVASKLPFIYDRIAVNFLSVSHEEMDSEIISKKREKAIAFLENADKEAMLSREGAALLFHHYKSRPESDRSDINENELERLATLAQLPESKTLFFTDK